MCSFQSKDTNGSECDLIALKYHREEEFIRANENFALLEVTLRFNIFISTKLCRREYT